MVASYARLAVRRPCQSYWNSIRWAAGAGVIPFKVIPVSRFSASHVYTHRLSCVRLPSSSYTNVSLAARNQRMPGLARAPGRIPPGHLHRDLLPRRSGCIPGRNVGLEVRAMARGGRAVHRHRGRWGWRFPPRSGSAARSGWRIG